MRDGVPGAPKPTAVSPVRDVKTKNDCVRWQSAVCVAYHELVYTLWARRVGRGFGLWRLRVASAKYHIASNRQNIAQLVCSISGNRPSLALYIQERFFLTYNMTAGLGYIHRGVSYLLLGVGMASFVTVVAHLLRKCTWLPKSSVYLKWPYWDLRR